MLIEWVFNFATDGLIVQMGASQGYVLNAIMFLDCCFLVDAKLGYLLTNWLLCCLLLCRSIGVWCR